MMAAYRAGVPQIIVPGDCRDQLRNGFKVERTNCGKLLRPREDINEDPGEVLEAVQTILVDQVLFESCIKWQQILSKSNGLTMNVQAVMRLIAFQMMKTAT